MLPPFKEALSKICTFLCFWKSTCCASVSTSSLGGRANSPDQQAENLLPNNTVPSTVNGNHVGASVAPSSSTRIESTTVEGQAAAPQNESGKVIE